MFPIPPGKKWKAGLPKTKSKIPGMKNINEIICIFLILGFTLLGCNPAEEREEPVQAINLSYFDSTVRVQDDFFGFINGNWIRQTEIPADQGRWGSFHELREFNNEAVLKVLNQAKDSGQYPDGSDQRKGMHFFQIGMDSLLAEKRAATPLEPIFEAIEKIKDMVALQAFLAENPEYAGGSFFNLGVDTDLKDSEKMALYLSQGGLGLPDRDYYLEGNEKFEEIKEMYQQHIAQSFQLLGYSEDKASQVAGEIVDLETRLAKASKTRIEMRDPEGRYNKYSLEELGKLTPSINWAAVVSDIGADTEELIISTPKFMEELENILSGLPVSTLQEYLKWNLINNAAPYLSHAFVKNNFDFY